MKELSIEEKEKAYDEVREKIAIRFGSNVADEIFSQFEMSKDERIRKVIYGWIYTRPSQFFDSGFSKEEMLAWLEKQGEQPQGKSALEAAKEEKVDNQNCVKPNNKVESKFKVKKGEWYVCTNTFVLNGKIIAIKGKTYQSKQEDDTITCEDNCLFIDRHDGKAFDYFRLWTIQDAKEGDVLVCPKYAGDIIPNIFIFKNIETKDNDVFCYCSFLEKFRTESYVANADLINTDFYPATKEQRDLLFQTIKEAGYEWDAEKKELKKIDNEIEIPFGTKDSKLQEVTYYIPKGFHAEIDDDKVVIKKSEEDEKIRQFLIHEVTETSDEIMSYRNMNKKDVLAWLKKKDEQKPFWSAEDEEMYKEVLTDIIYAKNDLKVKECYELSKRAMDAFNWFSNRYKSLRPQNTWKPSDEQMAALNDINLTGGISYAGQGQELITLYNDLKKLKEQSYKCCDYGNKSQNYC